MDDFLCTITCEEFYSSDDCLTEDEKLAILNEESENSEMVKNDMFNTVKNSISTCKLHLLNNDVESLYQWWIVGGHDNFENICYATSGPYLFIEDFGILSRDEVEIIYELDRQNAKIIWSAWTTYDCSQFHIALENLAKIAELYQMDLQ